jgi:hypothetical protein
MTATDWITSKKCARYIAKVHSYAPSAPGEATCTHKPGEDPVCQEPGNEHYGWLTQDGHTNRWLCSTHRAH